VANRDFIDRVDDGILVQAGNLARLRDMTLRGAIFDFRQTALDNVALSLGSEDEDVWRTRVDRCDMLLGIPDDVALRRRAAEAREHER
jgi:hypothetical protein